MATHFDALIIGTERGLMGAIGRKLLKVLVFATVAALALTRDWGLGYGELIAYATPGFFAFGLFALPAGWLADRGLAVANGRPGR